MCEAQCSACLPSQCCAPLTCDVYQCHDLSAEPCEIAKALSDTGCSTFQASLWLPIACFAAFFLGYFFRHLVDWYHRKDEEDKARVPPPTQPDTTRISHTPQYTRMSQASSPIVTTSSLVAPQFQSFRAPPAPRDSKAARPSLSDPTSVELAKPDTTPLPDEPPQPVEESRATCSFNERDSVMEVRVLADSGETRSSRLPESCGASITLSDKEMAKLYGVTKTSAKYTCYCHHFTPDGVHCVLRGHPSSAARKCRGVLYAKKSAAAMNFFGVGSLVLECKPRSDGHRRCRATMCPYMAEGECPHTVPSDPPGWTE
eukprot:Sspe_Gene.83598::Locus_54833_Transcript_1_1_Confidence_1.000_Length_999::g.83598::m.83598